MAVKPLEDRVIILPLEAEDRTESGIYLPESAKEKPVQGKVIACGPGKRLDNGERIKPSVSKGDTVVYGKYAGTEIQLDGDDVLIMRESDILGIVNG